MTVPDGQAVRCDYIMRRARIVDRCPHRARYRVVRSDTGTPPYEGEHACGRHVRPALMDNGDSVWKPWRVTAL